MESTALTFSPLLNRPFPATATSKQPRISTKLFSASRDCSGRIVDESMIILRKRMPEMKMIERNYEPPAEWMDWEKRYYNSYDSMICETMGVLQSLLMNTRPSVALGMTALIAVSVPTSAAVVFFQLVGMTKEILAGIHAVL